MSYSKRGAGTVKILFRILLSSVILLLGYECMVEAFHLMNQPSDSAVYTGMAILALLLVLVPVVSWQVWRKKHDHFR